ncbi:MAG: phosphonatase-like hydrolase [bacterium]
MNDIELVVFDLAGTTIEDAGEVPEAFTLALHTHGLTITREALHAARGASKREIIRHFVESQFSGEASAIIARTEQIFATFRQHLTEIYTSRGVRIIPGATETFTWLRRRDIKIALNTGFDRELTALILQAVKWDKDFVHAVICGDDVAQGRPAPYLIFHAMEATGVINVSRVANIGDTRLDIEAGRNAGVRWNIGVLSGAHRREQLAQEQPSHLLASVASVPALWN